MPLEKMANWLNDQFSGRSGSHGHRRQRHSSQRGPFFFIGWLLVIAIGFITLLHYALGDYLVELELFLEVKIFRLFLLFLCLLLLIFSLLRAQRAMAVGSGIIFFILGLEAWDLRLMPILPRSVHGRADLRVFTQNVGEKNPPEKWVEWLAQNPMDIVFLQEVYGPYRAQWKKKARALGFAYVLFQKVRSDAGIGIMIWSKHPMSGMEPIETSSQGGKKRYIARSRIEFGRTFIELIGLHIESFHIDRSGKRNLVSSAPFRLLQAQRIAQEVVQIKKETAHPIIVAGDFNSSPEFRSIRSLRDLLSDAWVEGGNGLGGTYPSFFPVVRIDAILHSGFDTEYARVAYIEEESDHRGVHAILNLGVGED